MAALQFRWSGAGSGPAVPYWDTKWQPCVQAGKNVSFRVGKMSQSHTWNFVVGIRIDKRLTVSLHKLSGWLKREITLFVWQFYKNQFKDILDETGNQLTTTYGNNLGNKMSVFIVIVMIRRLMDASVSPSEFSWPNQGHWWSKELGVIMGPGEQCTMCTKRPYHILSYYVENALSLCSPYWDIVYTRVFTAFSWVSQKIRFSSGLLNVLMTKELSVIMGRSHSEVI